MWRGSPLASIVRHFFPPLPVARLASRAMTGASGDLVECPACGGAGGGPFGRAGSAWDVETYECPRCEGTGRVALVTAAPSRLIPTVAAGLARTSADQVERPQPFKAAKGGPIKAPAAPAGAAMNPVPPKASTPKAR
jgi:hypothetical protein